MAPFGARMMKECNFNDAVVALDYHIKDTLSQEILLPLTATQMILLK